MFHKEAMTLAAAGYDVVLLAQTDSRRDVSGVVVKRVWAPRLPRVLRFLSLPLVLVQALAERADVYHLHNPDTLPLGVALKALGRRVVYDTHEDFSRRIAIREWIPRVLRPATARVVAAAERFLARIADGAIATQPAVAERLGAGAIVIGNPPRTDSLLIERVRRKAEALAGSERAELRAVYVGLVSEERGLLDMVDAAERVNALRPLRLRVIGPAVAGALAKASARPGWVHVDYHERMLQEDAFAYVAASDVGLAVPHDVADIACADPNKLYEYLALGKPFIASAFPEWRARLNGADAGWFVAPGSVDEIAAALLQACDPDERRRKAEAGAAFVRTYNWEREAVKLLALYARLLGDPAA